MQRRARFSHSSYSDASQGCVTQQRHQRPQFEMSAYNDVRINDSKPLPPVGMRRGLDVQMRMLSVRSQKPQVYSFFISSKQRGTEERCCFREHGEVTCLRNCYPPLVTLQYNFVKVYITLLFITDSFLFDFQSRIALWFRAFFRL